MMVTYCIDTTNQPCVVCFQITSMTSFMYRGCSIQLRHSHGRFHVAKQTTFLFCFVVVVSLFCHVQDWSKIFV